jgi:hypothetical protein
MGKTREGDKNKQTKREPESRKRCENETIENVGYFLMSI